MSYVNDLADILANVTNSSQIEVKTIDDGIYVYMIDYVRRGCSMKTVFNAYVDLTRFASDVANADNGGNPMPLDRGSRNVVEAHLSRLSLGKEIKCTKTPSPYTVERRRRVVKAFLRWLVSEDYIGHNPTKKLTNIPLRERFPSVWSLDDVERFLGTFDKSSPVAHRDYTMALLALSSGLRAGELALLRPIDVNLGARTLSVSEKGKTGARTAVMTGQAATELPRWIRRRNRELCLPSDAPLFPPIGTNGELVSTRPMRAHSISCIISKHAKQAGIHGMKLGAHALRHTAASHLARNGASAFEIQRFLGHTSIEMSQRYVAMNNEAVQRRVEVAGILAQLKRINVNEHQENSRESVVKSILSSR